MADPKWLKDLRGNVEGAVSEIAKLRRQNKSLKTQLDKAKKAATVAEKAAADAAPDPKGEQWRTERKEVRRRVARLTKSLEELA
jgi:regulator of replication initiation timing